MGINRVCAGAKKKLLLAIVRGFEEGSLKEFLEKVEVKFVEIQRWIPEEARFDKDPLLKV